MAEIDLRDQNNVRDMLPHKPMRLSMENKNLLSKKGDIYVGTGEFQTVIIEDDTYKIAETAKVSVPSELGLNESAILIYDKTNNLQYKKSSESGFVTYDVQQELSDEQKRTARNNIGAPAVSDLTFLSYKVDQTEIFVDSSEQGSSLKTTLLNNIFYGLTEDQKSSVRLNIGAGSAQGIAGIAAGNGIKVDSSTQSSPKVSVNLATNSGLVFDSSSPKKLKLNVNSTVQSGNKYWVKIDENNYPYVNVSVPSGNNQTIVYAPTTTASSGITSFGNNATVKLVPGDNITMMASASSTNNYIQINATDTTYSAAVGGGIKLNGTSFSLNTGTITGEKKYAVQLENGIPYVNVPWMNTTYTAGAGLDLNEATHVLSIERYSTSSGWSGLTFGTNSNGKRGLMLNAETLSRSGITSGDFDLRIDENNVPYTYIPGYVPIEYISSASSTTKFTEGTLYLIGTWGV